MRNPTRWTLVLALAGVLLAAPTATAQDRRKKGHQFLDYKLVRKAIPTMRDLSDGTAEHGRELHKLMDELKATTDEVRAKELRQQVGDLLTAYFAKKKKMVEVTKYLLGTYRSKLADQEIFDKLHGSMLESIRWKNSKFRDCARDVANKLKIPIRLHHHVVQMNQVTYEFNRVSAETVLSWLCNGFDLRYIVYDGEIVIYKKITPTEDRFIAYQKKHPDKELRYWDREGASGAMDASTKTAGVTASGQKWDLQTLDVDLLHESLLKIWIIEESSERHNQRRIAQKSFEALTPHESTGDEKIDEENERNRIKVDKHLRHYLRLELDNSIEAIDICQRVLGKNLVADPAEIARKQLLQKAIPDVKWRNKDLREALHEIGDAAGVKVEIRGIAKNATLTVDLHIEGATVGTTIEMISGIHFMTWKFENGTLTFDVE